MAVSKKEFLEEKWKRLLKNQGFEKYIDEKIMDSPCIGRREKVISKAYGETSLTEKERSFIKGLAEIGDNGFVEERLKALYEGWLIKVDINCGSKSFYISFF